MKQLYFSKWINSSGGALAALEKKSAYKWSGIDGNPSDYDLSCHIYGYER
ncbi:MAG: hypothetical protein LBQ52_04060 [Helicobacteraceae bacterium]|jgi:hypothetical protein|nr:hypothetical protein [Helicobacteraceae bacterium]